ncbi:MAG TPA: Rieske 2Fe-2S domain-containing protein [Gemmatimonadaceae bacterium]|nr:Rieske 2Fe-2S domain-containing protein [Gemmatimonadaceae bacterium]
MSPPAGLDRADGFERAAQLEDVPPDGLLGVRLAGAGAVCLIRCGDAVYAVTDECTHQAFPMSAGLAHRGPRGCELECVWHGARFDAATGAVRQGPALDPLPVLEVRVEGGEVWVRSRRRLQSHGQATH